MPFLNLDLTPAFLLSVCCDINPRSMLLTGSDTTSLIYWLRNSTSKFESTACMSSL